MLRSSWLVLLLVVVVVVVVLFLVDDLLLGSFLEFEVEEGKRLMLVLELFWLGPLYSWKISFLLWAGLLFDDFMGLKDWDEAVEEADEKLLDLEDFLSTLDFSVGKFWELLVLAFRTMLVDVVDEAGEGELIISLNEAASIFSCCC